jgi:uncharacterized membrane protein
VSFAVITLSVAPQRVFIFVVVYFVIDSVRKLLDTISYDVTATQTVRNHYIWANNFIASCTLFLFFPTGWNK